MNEIHTRNEAFEKKLHKYYTGRPCVRGHLTFRYVRTGQCVDCVRQYAKKFAQQTTKRTVSITIDLWNSDDIPALKAYANSLNLSRQLDEIANGRHIDQERS